MKAKNVSNQPHKNQIHLVSVFVLTGIAVIWWTADKPDASENMRSQNSSTAQQSQDEPPSIAQFVDDEVKKVDTTLFMQAKLANSQKVMEGLVTGNYDLIDAGARQMKKISMAAHWPSTDEKIYGHLANEFRRQCDKLVEHADARDLRAAHYAYLHMSTTCIDCHSHVRKNFSVKHSKIGPPVQLIPTQWDKIRKKNR